MGRRGLSRASRGRDSSAEISSRVRARVRETVSQGDHTESIQYQPVTVWNGSYHTIPYHANRQQYNTAPILETSLQCKAVRFLSSLAMAMRTV